MEIVCVLNKENDVIAGNEVKGGKKMGKGATVETVPRKGLADISNFPQNNQVARKSDLISTDIKGYIEKLKQEIVELVKLVVERNKIIEMRGIELQKLIINYQKVQQQNLQLAQANTQILADLNSGKDRLKVLQHELGCINGLARARKLESKDKANTVKCQAYKNGVETIKSETAGQLAQTDKVEDIACNTKRKRQSKIQSLDTANDKPIQKTENGGNKRRQSARFKSCEQEPNDSVNRNDALSLATLKSDQADEKVEIIKSETAGQLAQTDKVEDKACNTKRKRQSKIQSLDTANDKPIQKTQNGGNKRRQSTRFKSCEQEPNDSVNRNDALSLATLKSDQADEKVDKERLQSRRQSARLKSEGKEQTEYLFETSDPLVPASAEGVQAGKKRANDNRLVLRRQSARLKSQESVQEPTRDLDQMDDVKLYVPPLPNEPVSESCQMPSVLSVKNESEASDGAPELKAQEQRKSSVRPTRQAAGKVQSYKEIPLNVKMRR